MNPSRMSPSQNCIDLVMRSEGCKLKAYLCPAGVWTIGYGATLGVQPGDVISQGRAEGLLRDDLAARGPQVEKRVSVPLTQNQFDALVSFVYNVGVAAFHGSTLRAHLNLGDYAGAAAEFPRWNMAGGRILPGLVVRRADERALFERP